MLLLLQRLLLLQMLLELLLKLPLLHLQLSLMALQLNLVMLLVGLLLHKRLLFQTPRGQLLGNRLCFLFQNPLLMLSSLHLA